jgi:RNA polymerase sigma factor (sigma-70 family)
MAVAIDVAAPCTASAGVDALEREELRREIALALEPLTDMQRSVLIARTFEELTFADIAVELGVAVPTVKTHYLRAVSAVRDRLARSQDQERV